MSIRINKDKCIGCTRCLNICPGNLIYKDEFNKAYIKYDDSCWGCAACLKECNFEAIEYYLDSDISKNNSFMTVKIKDEELVWSIKDIEGDVLEIKTSRKESNNY